MALIALICLAFPTYAFASTDIQPKSNSISLKDSSEPPANGDSSPIISYRACLKGPKWTKWASDGSSTGGARKKARVELIQLKMSGIEGSIEYRTRVQNKGWLKWAKDGRSSGCKGQNLRLDALMIRLKGAAAESYNIKYRIYTGKFGWSGWAQNGDAAGAIGYETYIRKIQVALERKDNAAAPEATVSKDSKVALKDATKNKKKYVNKKRSRKLVSASRKVGFKGSGYCAKWTNMVYFTAGFDFPDGHAKDLYRRYCNIDDISLIQPGMIIAVPSHSRSGYDGRRYGHVGMYIGHGKVKHNVSKLKTVSLEEWLDYYQTDYKAKCGWATPKVSLW